MVLSNDVIGKESTIVFTIQQFADKTGLTASTLRFYDKKNLLKPERRLENGYRVYKEEQISDALLIHSLRNADIPIEEIKYFLQANENEKNKLISKWRQEVHSKLSALKIAQQYLGGIGPQENHMHLVRWEESATFIWHKHVVPRKAHPFQDVMLQDREQLSEMDIKLGLGYYVRQLDSRGDQMMGEVGFLTLTENILPPLDTNWYVEKQDPTLFASMECSVGNEFICFQFIQMIRQFGFVPTGKKLEKFENVDSHEFKYLIPIMKL
ncbi:MerR family transcriptional regulator [Bacillus sp. CGMCC 1.16607]|uniref:MerR family transcriptional regulator n=1 Tax=Bacillus sp. CGMCC 1.16607 TaxID=3351842 RepID=UPI0036262889